MSYGTALYLIRNYKYMLPSGNTKAVIFDRDGVLNKLVWHEVKQAFTAPWTLDEFEIMSESRQQVQRCRKAGFLGLCVTNQPDVYDHHLHMCDLFAMTLRIYDLGIVDVRSALERDTQYYKPNNGIVEDFICDYSIARQSSYIVGDSWKDIVCGHRSQLKTIYIGNQYEVPPRHDHIVPDFIVPNLARACDIICGESND